MNVSIIIPFYNTNITFLKDLFDCIDKSERQNLEFIFVNDGSSLEISDYVHKYCLKNNFKFISVEENKGVSNARNIGLKEAKFNKIMFVDSDDFANFTLVNNLILDRDFDIVLFKDAIMKKENDFIIKKMDFINTAFSLPELYEHDNLGLNLRSSCCKILDKKIILDNNIAFETKLLFYEDAMFMSEYYLKCSNYIAFSNILYFYRLHSGSSSKSFNKKYFEKYELFFNEYKAKFKNEKLLIASLYKDTFKKVLIDKFIRAFKKMHLQYAYKILKLNCIKESADYILSTFDDKSFEHKLAKRIQKKHYFCAFNKIVFSRMSSSLRIRIKKLLKK